MGLQRQTYYGKGASLVEAIERKIGFDTQTGLIKDGSFEGVFLDTFENSSLGIAYVLQGRKEEAKRILEGIETYIGIDSETGLFYNKKGLSENESKKVLPGERTLYLSNQALISTLFWILGDKDKAKELEKKFEKEIGTFGFDIGKKKYKIYRHSKNQDHFYPFNNLLVAINKASANQKNEAKKLVENIEEICWDKEMRLLRSNSKNKVYFTLNNALLATYLAISRKEREANNIIKTLEDKIGFDKKTGLVFEGFTPQKHIKNILTYSNTQMAISYLTLAGLFPKNK